MDVGKFSVAHKVVDIWNSLAEEIVACDTIIVSKRDLINVCMVEDLYKLFKLPSLMNLTWTGPLDFTRLGRELTDCGKLTQLRFTLEPACICFTANVNHYGLK